MSNRTYSQALNDGKGAANFPYIFDPTVITVGPTGVTTGAWRPYTSDDISNTQVDVSGLNLTVGAVSITGNPSVQISNFPNLTPISGIVSVSNSILPISGVTQANITNTAPINVTGIINTVVTGTIGGNVTVNSVAITGAPVVTITGVVATSASVTVGSVAVTGGNISVSNTAPIPVSGVVVTTVSVGNVAITGFDLVIAPLAVTGIVRTITTGSFSATVDNTTLISAVASGNAYNAAISGLLSASATDAAWITGQVSISNTSPLAISGVVLTVVTGTVSSSITNPIGITGTARDNNIVYNNGTIYNILPVGGRAVAATGAGAPTGYASGAYAMLNINQSNGGLFVNQGVLDSTIDAVSIVGSGGYIGITGTVSTSVSNTAPIPISGVVVTTATIGNVAITGAPIVTITGVVATSTSVTVGNVAVTGGYIQITGINSGIIFRTQPTTATVASNYVPSGILPYTGAEGFTGIGLLANPNRIMMFVQNIHTGIPLYVGLGTNDVTATNFSLILNPSSTRGFAGDSFSDDHWRGQVNLSGGAWQIWEI